MRKCSYNYIVTMAGGHKYTAVGSSKRMVERALSMLQMPVAHVERVYKTGERSTPPF